ncbi:HI1506-related protein [Caldimonas sp. KR1-144]|uniref:HI1506-related protein n=1 Tax=Caldimonas sp. KR1-144 TaxID=3400911 RepID=UPI003C1158F9
MAKTNNSKPAAQRVAGAPIKALKVISRRDSFRRAGFEFTGEAKTLPLDELTDDQVEALKAEPLLVVSEVDIEPEKAETPAT